MVVPLISGSSGISLSLQQQKAKPSADPALHQLASCSLFPACAKTTRKSSVGLPLGSSMTKAPTKRADEALADVARTWIKGVEPEVVPGRSREGRAGISGRSRVIPCLRAKSGDPKFQFRCQTQQVPRQDTSMQLPLDPLGEKVGASVRQLENVGDLERSLRMFRQPRWFSLLRVWILEMSPISRRFAKLRFRKSGSQPT